MISSFLMSSCSLIQTNEVYIQPVKLPVITSKCPTSPLTVATFKTSCNFLSEVPFDSNIVGQSNLVIRAVQNIPANATDDQKIQVGENIHFEFFNKGQKLPIPEQNFQTFWATDFLGISVSYLDDQHIYVQGTFPTITPAPGFKYSYPNGGAFDNVYTYFYDGKKWTELFPQDLVNDYEQLQLFVSNKTLKLINPRKCLYDFATGTFKDNDKNQTLTGTAYIIDANSYKLISAKNLKCENN